MARLVTPMSRKGVFTHSAEKFRFLRKFFVEVTAYKAQALQPYCGLLAALRKRQFVILSAGFL